MARKQTVEGGKKREIIEAALKLFLANGYDGTSVRMIQKEVGSEVGLFYYYFKSKDELFDYVIDHFFAAYREAFTHIVMHGRRNPCRVMTDFFEYMERETSVFRERYAGNIHRTTRWAIRERTLEIIEPYLLEIVRLQSQYYAVKPPVSPEAAALYLTHGVGSSILHESPDKYKSQRNDIMRGVSILMGMPAEEQELRIPLWAADDDLRGLAEFLSDMRPAYPEPLRELRAYIERGEALMYRHEGRVVAGLLYSAGRQTIDFLAVRPEYRRRGLGGRLVETAAAQFAVGTELSAVVLRGAGLIGDAARGFYQAAGFRIADGFLGSERQYERMVVTVADKPINKRSVTDDE